MTRWPDEVQDPERCLAGLLEGRVRPERIADVVRRPADQLGGRSLLDLAKEGRTDEVRQAIRTMFDLRRIQP